MYPICLCCIEKDKSGAFFLRKTGETKRKKVSPARACFLCHLDGKTDPYTLAPDLSAEQLDELLAELKEQGFVSDSRWNGSFLMPQFTLWFVPRHIPAAVRRACREISTALLFVWLPVLIAGMMQILRANWTDGGSSTLGMVLGLLAGVVFHEAGHAVGCVGFGGRFVRVGICSQLVLIPGAFVEVDYVLLPRAARIQTVLSGVEMNFLLAGAAGLAGVVIWGEFFAMFGLMNAMLGLLNQGVYFIGMDGAKALGELIGADLSLSEKILEEHRARRTIRRRGGVTGRARIAATHVLCVLQLGILSLMILNLKEVISWIF